MTHAETASSFTRLRTARSVAVVGASEGSYWVRCLLDNLSGFGFTGSVHLVHPTREEILGRPCHPSVSAVPEQVDLAFVLTSARHLDGIVADLARAGVGSAVALTSGFAELGAEGAAEQARLVAACERHGIALLGPNCLGFIDYHTGLAPFCDLIQPPMPPGHVAVVSQSGGLLQLVHRAAQRRSIGLSHMVSVGNESMVTATDVMLDLVEVPQVRVLATYLEGIREPEKFLRLAERALELGKPIVALKTGRSEAAASSAKAHTGALTGDDRIVDTIFERYGVTRVSTSEEMLEIAALFAELGVPSGPRLGLVTSSGGTCGIGADLTEQTCLQLPAFSTPLREELRGVLPDFATPQNPLDTTGAIVNDRDMLGRCTAVLAASGELDMLIVNVDLPPLSEHGDDAATTARLESVRRALTGLDLPAVLTPTFAGDSAPERIRYFRDAGIAVADGLGTAVAALAAYVAYGAARERRLVGGTGRARPRTGGVRAGSARTLSESESLRFLADAGVPANTGVLVRRPEQSAGVGSELGFPLVAKVHSSQIAHKSELGGVRLGLSDDAAVRQAVEDLLRLVPSGEGEVLLVPQVTALGELIAGVVVDELWGPMILVGVGGVFAEIFDDVVLGLPDLGHDEALRMVRSLRGIDLFTGARGRAKADLDRVAEVLVALGRLAGDLPENVSAIDVNPLFVCEDSVVAGDALVVLTDAVGHEPGGQRMSESKS